MGGIRFFVIGRIGGSLGFSVKTRKLPVRRLKKEIRKIFKLGFFIILHDFFRA